MKTYSVHYGVRVTKHDQSYPIRDFVDNTVIKDAPTRAHALAQFGRWMGDRREELANRPGLTVAEELHLLVPAMRVLAEVCDDIEQWPAQILLEDSSDYGLVTGRVWLTVTWWANDRDRVEVSSDAD